MGQQAKRWTFGWCRYDEGSRTLYVHGKKTDVQGKTLDMLRVILEMRGGTVSSDELNRQVWDGTAGPTTVTVAMSKLREAFGGEDLHSLIQTVRSEGYRMRVEVFSEWTSPAATQLALQVGGPIPGHPSWIAVERLGHSEASPVWLGTNDNGSENRVFKFVMDAQRVPSLRREVEVAERLRGSGIPAERVRRIHAWNFKALPYSIECEYVGPNLRQFAATNEFAALDRAGRVEIATMLADAVATTHALGILHNDLKPGNVLVRLLQPGADTDRPLRERFAIVLIDFADSTLVEGDRAQRPEPAGGEAGVFDGAGPPFATAGSELYRAPEIRAGGPGTAAADVYALGVMLYQTLLGDFDEIPAAGWQAEVADPLLEDDIARSAHRLPESRFPTASELAGQLHALGRRREDAGRLEADRQRTLRVQRELERTRARRPWVVSAFVMLLLGVGVSLWFARSAARQRDVAQRQNATLQGMLRFLQEDVLGQNSLVSGSAESSKAAALTLNQAIQNAIPQVDRRFPNDPMTAGRLHEAIADGLRSRTLLVEAEKEYQAAEAEYRKAEGPLSQAAILAGFKEDVTTIVFTRPGGEGRIREHFEKEAALVRQLPHPSPEVLIYQDADESGLVLSSNEPARALALVQRAMQRAEAPGVDPALLRWLKGRVLSVYVRTRNGPALETAANERIREITERYGPDSPLLPVNEMFLQEALHLQGKYIEAVAQADRNYPRFRRLMGEHHQYTLAVLASRAASLQQLGRYEEAMRDDLTMYELEGTDPNGFMFREGGLDDAAMAACRAGHFQQGLAYARQVLKETGPEPNALPGFYNGAKFAIAECLVGGQESSGRMNAAELTEAEKLLHEVDPKAIERQEQDEGYSALVKLAEARADMLRHDPQAATQALAGLEKTFARPDIVPYEAEHYHALRDKLAHSVAGSQR